MEMKEPNVTPHDPSVSGPPPFPERLRKNLEGFRSTMRRSKLAEALLAAGLCLLISFLAVAALDRFFETDALLRAVLFFASLGATLLVVPRALNRWYLRHSDLREVAREISIDNAAAGDRLLGVFDLTRDRSEFELSLIHI